LPRSHGCVPEMSVGGRAGFLPAVVLWSGLAAGQPGLRLISTPFVTGIPGKPIPPAAHPTPGETAGRPLFRLPQCSPRSTMTRRCPLPLPKSRPTCPTILEPASSRLKLLALSFSSGQPLCSLCPLCYSPVEVDALTGGGDGDTHDEIGVNKPHLPGHYSGPVHDAVIHIEDAGRLNRRPQSNAQVQ